MSRRYYEEEMRYLHEAGKEFAQAHPAQARFLNVDSVADRDPYVERLFEGFAFLTGRIRERLDDEIPQYTEGLFQLMHPHFLKPFPSCSILQCNPKPGQVQETMTIEQGAEVRSRPVGDEKTSCRFTTTQAVRLNPLQLKEATLHWDSDGTASVTMRFALDSGIEYEKLDLHPLRLFFHAEPTVASMAYLFFTRHVKRMEIRSGEKKVSLNGQVWIQPAGLAEEEGLLPYSRYSFNGFRLLQEYFQFRTKFWFVDLHGLDRFTPPEKAGTFEVQLFFDRSYPEEKRFRTENIRLHCTPIVNLFQDDAEPIRVERLVSEYLVIPSVRHRRSTRVYSVDTVVGIEERTGKQWEYEPYFSFHRTDKTNRSFSTTVREGPSGRKETYLSISAPSVGDIEGKLPIETLTVELTCTNGGLPRDKLQEKMITQGGSGIPSVVEVENLTQPTLEVDSPAHDHPTFLWKLLSHLSFNHMTVASKEALRGVLSLYEWTDTEANRRRLAGIRDVAWAPKELMVRGAVLRGAEVTVQIEEGHFADEGDLCLFGLALSEFLSLYATINSFVHLTLVLMPSEKRYEWHTKKGQQPVL